MIDFQNGILKVLKEEIVDNGDQSKSTTLKKILSEFLKKEISLVQVAQENTGVIIINANDRQWIERVCRASLQNADNYFIRRDTALIFDYLYVQSYMIRTYLLYCPINYEHMKSKYQCFVKQNQPATTNEAITTTTEIDISLKQKWSHLEQLSLDRLQLESKYLQHIRNMLDTVDDKTLDKISLSEFIENTNYGNDFAEKYDEYGMKDFPLSSIDTIQRLYEEAINNFQNTFAHITQSMRIRLEPNKSNELDKNLENFFLIPIQNDDQEVIEKRLENITDFINNLKQSYLIFQMQPAESFEYVCEVLEYSADMYKLIPVGTKCENYVQVCQKLIDIRSVLYEKKINIRERITTLWNPYVDEPNVNSMNTNDFEAFRHSEPNPSLDIPTEPSQPSTTAPGPSNPVKPFDFFGDFDMVFPPVEEPSQALVAHSQPGIERMASIMEYQSQGEMKINLISSPSPSSSLLFQVIQSKLEQMGSIKVPARLTVYLPEEEAEKKARIAEGKARPGEKKACTAEKFYDKFREIFKAKITDSKLYGIIDPDRLHVDFWLKQKPNEGEITANEYEVIKRSELISIEIDFEKTITEFLATGEANLSAIISRFILNRKSEFQAPKNHFHVFDQQGKLLTEDCLIKQLHQLNKQTPIRLEMIRSDSNNNHVYEVTLTADSSKDNSLNSSFISFVSLGEPIVQIFSLTTTWKQINDWLVHILQSDTGENTSNFNFWWKEKQTLIENNQLVSSTVVESTPTSVDIISGDAMIDIVLSYDKISQNIRILKSMPVGGLLQNKQRLNQFNLKVSPEDCILVLGQTEKTNLEGDDLNESIQYYASTSDETLHFQIAILIRITKYADQSDSSQISLTIPHRNYSIRQLLDMIKEQKDNYEYLASTNGKVVLTEQTILSHQKTNTFYLVKHSQTCLVSIKQSRPVLIAVDDGPTTQRYIIDATLHDVFTDNSDIESDHSIQYKDFIPSRDTKLRTLMTEPSKTLEFTVITGGSFAEVTIVCEEKQNPINLKCTPSITFGHLNEIVCSLWKLNPKCYQIMTEDDFAGDNDTSLTEEGESITDVQIKLVLSADWKCTVQYLDQTCIVSAMNETSASEILQQAINEFSIPIEEIESFKLYLLDDTESPSEIDGELSIKTMREDLPAETTVLLFQLRKE